MCNDITENVRLVEAVQEGGVKQDGANRSARLEATIWAGFLEQDCSICFPVRATKIPQEARKLRWLKPLGTSSMRANHALLRCPG